MKLIRLLVYLLLALFLVTPIFAYVIIGSWDDTADITIDVIFLPEATWRFPAEYQLSEWNEVDSTNNSHPFWVWVEPFFFFTRDDGRSTMGFLDEAGLNSEYGLSFAQASAWTVCLLGDSGLFDECDVMFNYALPWNLIPDDQYWFQSTVLHETGHIRGLGHFNEWLSMQNTADGRKLLRDEILYMDDREGVRQIATTVTELDIVIYPKWHEGILGLPPPNYAQWMTMTPTTLKQGEVINFFKFSVENRGSLPFDSPVRLGIYLSTNPMISTSDTLLNTASFESFDRFSESILDGSATIPQTFSDCATRYIGAVIDDNALWIERYEGNNAVAFSNGTYDPTPITIQLQDDAAEPNDTQETATSISLNYFNSGLSIDEDREHDYYAFTLAETRSLEIDVLFSHASGDIDLDLLDPDGYILASSYSITDNEHIQKRLDAGTYCIYVYGWGDGSCNQYGLSVQSFECTLASDCDDGLFCNGTEMCSSNSCMSSVSPCSDSDPCTLDLCNESTDSCSYPQDPAQDSDADAICDTVDNCPSVYNPDQLDTDSDVLGNACDDDDDNDGVADIIDCEPLNVLVWGLPGEVTGAVFFADKQTLTWNPPANPGGVAVVYEIHEGVPADLAKLLTPDADSCVRWAGTTTTTGSLTQVPALGSFTWYLVTAKNACGDGVAGNASAGPRILNTWGSCPG